MPEERTSSSEAVMAYNFLPYHQEQLFLMPLSLREWVADGSLARFVSDAVEALDRRGALEGIYGAYREDGWGRAAYHPCLMVKVVLYGYAVGVRSSRKLAHALEQDVGFRYLAANQAPDFRTLAAFRREHLEALDGLFVHVLELCKEAGLVQVGRVALDGRRVAGNAALARNRTRAELQALVKQILKEAEETDRAEDERYGEDQRGDELPEGLRDPQERKKRICAALDALEARERQAKEAQGERVKDWENQKVQGKAKGARPKADPKQRTLDLLAKARANTTDPDSRPLKTRHGWVQGYNGQIMVDCENQIIVAQDLTSEADDRIHLPLLLERVEQQAGARPVQCLADAGYWSEANAGLGGDTTELFIAVQGGGHADGPGVRPRTRAKRIQPNAQHMQATLRSERGREIYRWRGRTVEPVFGQMCMRGLNQILLRGLGKARGEWSLWCTTHNLLKLWRSGTTFCPA